MEEPEKKKGPEDPRLKPVAPMAYGTTARPPIQGLATVVAELPVELVLDDTSSGSLATLSKQPLRRRRFVFIGDVHGQRTALEDLLAQIRFDAAQDHLVLTGDLVNKGVDSAGVVQLAMDLGASAVRGNHDDRVLLAYEALQALRQGELDAEAAEKKAKAQAKQEKPVDLATDVAARMRKQASIAAEGRRERALARLQREEEEQRRERGGDTTEDATATPTPTNGGGDGGAFAFFRGRTNKKPEEKSEEDMLNLGRVNADLLVDPQAQNTFDRGDAPERAAAASLSPAQYRWLADLPSILHLGPIAPAADEVSEEAADVASAAPFHDVVVVHAGLVPGVALAQQDPMAVMTMRSLVHPADEARRDLARSILDYEARMRALARSGGRNRGSDRVRLSDSQINEEFHKMQKEAYGPDLQHPPVDLEAAAALSLRTTATDLVLLPIEGHFQKGQLAGPDNNRLHWAAVWNQVQHAKADPTSRTTVIYGHDAITGLAVPANMEVPIQTTPQDQTKTTSSATPSSSPGALAWLLGFGGGLGRGQESAASAAAKMDTGYTFGLDTGCVYGRQLTALIVEAGKDGQVQYYLEQVACTKGGK